MNTLSSLNTLDAPAFVALLHGIYEHSPWIAERAASRPPFASLAALKLALQEVVSGASEIVEAQAAPCAPRLMELLGAAVERAGVPRFDWLPGISHDPLETMTADDAELAGQVLVDFLRSVKAGPREGA